MTGLVIPSIFTAIDKISAPMRNMSRNVGDFAAKSEAATARSERMFRKLTPALSDAAKQFLSFASTAAVAAAIIGGLNFSAKSIIAYEDAIASFRTIVSDLSDKDFANFETKIASVATTTNASAVDVAASFEKVAGLNAKFAETADGLGQVSAAAIVLSRASKEELGKSAENLVGIMNQFSLGADQANRTINVLAAGTAVGAASITQTAEAFVNFGSVAAGANISLEQSVGLVQTLGKFSLFGAEAGTKLRGSVLKLQQAGVGYKSGQFQINDALVEAKARMDKLSTAKAKDALLTKMFGAENISTGRILISNIGLIKEYTAGVTGTNEAQKAAAINMATFSAQVQILKNKFVNWITTSDEAKKALTLFKNVVVFVGDNLSTIVKIIGLIIAAFAVWFVWIKLTRVALVLMRAVSAGLFLVDTIKYVAATQGITFAQAAWAIVLESCTSAMTALSAAMFANPIGLIIIGVILLIALVYQIIQKWNEWGAALTLFMGPLGMIISLFQSFRTHWDEIVKAFKTEGIVSGLKMIGKTILDSFLYPIQQGLEILARITGMDWAAKGAASIAQFRKEMFPEGTKVENSMIAAPQAQSPFELLNPKAVQQDALVQKMENTNNANVNINIKDPNNRTSAHSDNDLVNIKTTSTMAWGGG